MRRLILITATTALAFLLLAPPAWAEWVWPLRGEVITPYRNGDDPYASGQHRGIDIEGPVGAPVAAAAGGEVRFAGNVGSSGLTVSIRTADGRFDTSYLHLSSTAVREGDRVTAGDRVGAVGTTGVRSAAAPHLHFGVREAGSRHAYLDPLALLPPAPGAPEAPRGAPAPQPAPVAPGPAPAPVRQPAGRRVPVGAPAPRRVPVRVPSGRRAPVGAPSPRRVPAHAPSTRRIPVGAPSPRSVPIDAPSPRRVPVDAPGRAPAHRQVPADAHRAARIPSARDDGLPAQSRAPSGHRASMPAHAPAAEAGGRLSGSALAGSAADRAAGGHPSSGPDAGLVLAWLGLLAAAALLGVTSEGQRASRKAGQRIARALQPVLGRR